MMSADIRANLGCCVLMGDLASNGVFIPSGSLSSVMHEDASGNIDYIETVYLGVTYRRTIVWNAESGNPVSVTAWEPQ